MSLPVNYRKAIRDDALDALRLIVEDAAEYTITVPLVTSDTILLATTRSSSLPALSARIGDETDDPFTSKRHQMVSDLVVHGLVRSDEHRFPNMSIEDIGDLLIENVKKALDIDPTRGVQAVFIGRTIGVGYDFEDNFGAITIVDQYQYHRPC